MADDPAARLREVVERLKEQQKSGVKMFVEGLECLVLHPKDALILLAAAEAMLSVWALTPRLAAAVRPEESPPS